MPGSILSSQGFSFLWSHFCGEKKRNGQNEWKYDVDKEPSVPVCNLAFWKSEDVEISAQVMVKHILLLFSPCKAEFLDSLMFSH